nr:hypothetical protein [Tanacetum cinerariifolium]
MAYNVQGLQQMSHIKKKNVIQYPRFTKLIIANTMEKYESVPNRLEEDYHTIKDDTLLVNVYTTGKSTRTPNPEVVQKRKRKGKQVAGESSSPKPSLKIRIKQQKVTPTTPLPPSDDQECDEIIESTQLSLALEKRSKVYEEQPNVAEVKEQLLEDDVQKIVKGEDDSGCNDFADTVLLSDEDFDHSISHQPWKIIFDDIIGGKCSKLRNNVVERFIHFLQRILKMI